MSEVHIDQLSEGVNFKDALHSRSCRGFAGGVR